ncbi:MAG: MFS transporter [Spirochaetes bacterium]|nr:MFS transporter [Spirochaetota bacterium]
MPDGLLGVAWPSMRASFGQELDALGLLLAGGTVGYLVSSLASGWTIQRLGVGRVLGFSCLLTATAIAGYTVCPWWPAMFGLAMAAGLGAGAIDAGLNVWVEAHLDRHLMHWLHGSFGIGITMGPLIMTAGLASFGSWRPGYWVVACLQLTLALVFLTRTRLWDKAPLAAHARDANGSAEPSSPYSATLRNPASWASAALFFVYTGVEVGMGHWAYSWMTSELGYSATKAGFWTGAYWASFTVGRFVAGSVNRRLSSEAVLRAAATAAAIACGLVAFAPAAALKGVFLAAFGLCIGPIFPAMVSTTAARVGRGHSTSTIGLQMGLAGAGVGVLPGLIGLAAARTSLGAVPVLVFALAVTLLGSLSLFRARASR